MTELTTDSYFSEVQGRIKQLLREPKRGAASWKYVDTLGRQKEARSNCHGTTIFVLGLEEVAVEMHRRGEAQFLQTRGRPGYFHPVGMKLVLERLRPINCPVVGGVVTFWGRIGSYELCHSAIYTLSEQGDIFHQHNGGGEFEPYSIAQYTEELTKFIRGAGKGIPNQVVLRYYSVV